MKPKIILVNGYPSTGKTTLAAKLSHDLGIPELGKDHLKEFLADTLNVTEDPWSAVLGRATGEMMIELLRAVAGTAPIILESAFIYEFCHDEIEEILHSSGTSAIEVYCTTDREERLKRSHGRIGSGERHAIHRDVQTIHDMDEAALHTKYLPLHVGEYLQVDTTHFESAEYEKLLDHVRNLIKE